MPSFPPIRTGDYLLPRAHLGVLSAMHSESAPASSWAPLTNRYALYSLYTSVSSAQTIHGFNPLPDLDSILQGNLRAAYFGNFRRDKDSKTGSWRWRDTREGVAACDSFPHLQETR
jgi:hypothetical protein